VKKLFCALYLFSWLFVANAQVTNSAGYGEEIPSAACLACPGTDWNNLENITMADGKLATTGLSEYGFCFMSTCYYNRFLYARNFKFSIPADASIDSIFVDIKRTAFNESTIVDTIVQIEKGGSMVGENLASLITWPTNLAYQSYGHEYPLWGTTWLPAEINDSTTGVVLKILNLSGSEAQAGVDHIQMTVYYTTTNGIHSVTESPSDIEWINSSGEIEIKFLASSSEQIFSKIYNSSGQEIRSFNVEQSIIGENNFQFSIGNLPEGIYFLMVNIGGHSFTRKFIK
jgi:hypothetical protein